MRQSHAPSPSHTCKHMLRLSDARTHTYSWSLAPRTKPSRCTHTGGLPHICFHYRINTHAKHTETSADACTRLAPRDGDSAEAFVALTVTSILLLNDAPCYQKNTSQSRSRRKLQLTNHMIKYSSNTKLSVQYLSETFDRFIINPSRKGQRERERE